MPYSFFFTNKFYKHKSNKMTEEELDRKVSEIVMLMAEVGTFGTHHLYGTPLNMIFLGVSTALIATGTVDDNDIDEDMKNASIDLLKAIEAVINSSRLLSEVDIQNKDKRS